MSEQLVWIVAIDGGESYWPQAAFLSLAEAEVFSARANLLAPGVRLTIIDPIQLHPTVPSGPGQIWDVELEDDDEDCGVESVGDQICDGEHDESLWIDGSLVKLLNEKQTSNGWRVLAVDRDAAAVRARELEAAKDAY